MTLEEAIDDFLDSHVHIYVEDGAYVNKEYRLKFDVTERSKLFGGAYYMPHYRDWLLENSELIKWV